MEIENSSTAVECENVASTSSDVLKSRLGLCEVCGFHEAKYTCPKCEVKTCGLRCSKIHKLELECDGVRERTKFIPLNKFTNLDLASDYRLLEEITRNVQTYKKSFIRRFSKPHKELPHHLLKLKNAANERQTTLKFLPPNFQKRKSNTSQINFASKIIFWHIEWIFPNADDIRLTDQKIPETEKLSSVLAKYFMKQEDPVLQEKLQFYQSSDISGVRLFLKAEERPGRKFFELDSSASVKENLRHKIIIEYPTVHVVLKQHVDSYDIIDSDDEDDDKEVDKTRNQVVESIIKKAEQDENLYKSLKNLLFISEYSDGELSPED